MAQSKGISGKVIDIDTGNALPNVTVMVENTTNNAVTDAYGNFAIYNLKQGDYTVVFSHISYILKRKKVHLTKDDSINMTVKMQSKTENINEVIVTAKTEARKAREQAMPISVISMSQLRGTVTDIKDVLNKTVGVTIRSSGGVGSASRLSVRGLEGKRIGFFIDETPLSDQSDFIDINDIPVDLIDRIEIYKGVVPAKFGGSAMGGAVNIVIREYPDKYADVSYEISSFNTHKVQTVVKRNLEDAGVLFSIGGGYTYSDNNYTMEAPYIKGLKVKRNHDNFKKILLGGSIKATKWWFDEVEFEPVFIDTYKEVQGIKYDVREAHTKSRAYILANTLKKQDFLMEGLDLDMSTAVAYTEYSLIDTAKVWYDWYGKSYPTTSVYGGELGTYASDSDNKKFTILNKLNLEYLINKQHTLNFNSVFTLANGYPKDELRKLSFGKQTLFDSKMRSLTVGLTYDYRSKDDRLLNAFTLRYYNYWMKTKSTSIYGITQVEDVNTNKSALGINNAIRYRMLRNVMAKFSVGYDVRIPSETELLGDGYSITPSENLMPEKNTSINFGVLYDLSGKQKSNLQIEFNTFYMYLKDMIRYTAGILGAQYQNFGEMRTVGSEIEVKADILPILYGYANVTYQDLRDVREYEENSTVANPTKGKRMPNIPYFMSNAGLEFHKENLFGGKGQNTRVFLDMAYIHQYYYDFELTNLEKRRIPTALTFDLGVEHSFNNQLYISGKVKNLTNETVLSEFNRPLPGINFGVKLRYVFKPPNPRRGN